ncbi:MAG: GDP-mannose 4,6-dehydratase [Fibrobacteria bacterium]|nr:GDP-mannose 4,6-dehydratase [Fibrobacteria bacterium]
MNILITGINGLIGKHWAQTALEKGWEVAGIDRKPAPGANTPIFAENTQYCDILDSQALQDVFIRYRPDLVVHLAAQSFSAISWQMEELTHNTNYFGTLRILQTTRKIVPHAQVILPSTSLVYGIAKPEHCPLGEDRPLKPVTPYAVTKAAGEHLGYQYYQNFGLQVFLPRFFNLLGPGHQPNTAVQNFSRQLALIKLKKQEPILNVGNLEAGRDFLDVRDAISAMLCMIEKGHPGEPLNICSGRSMTIAEILKTLIEVSGLQVTVQKDSARLRPSDEPLLYGDNTALKKLGWKAIYSLEETLQTVYADWLEREK